MISKRIIFIELIFQTMAGLITLPIAMGTFLTIFHFCISTGLYRSQSQFALIALIIIYIQLGNTLNYQDEGPVTIKSLIFVYSNTYNYLLSPVTTWIFSWQYYEAVTMFTCRINKYRTVAKSITMYFGVLLVIILYICCVMN